MLSLFVKNYADVKLGPLVRKIEFTPPPKVDSQVIVMEPHAAQVSDAVFGLIKRGFSSPRKKLIHNLAGLTSTERLKQIFEELGIDLNARPGDIKLVDWERLYQFL